MSINAAKCVHIEDTKVNSSNIGEVLVSVVRSHKGLGVTVSHDLRTMAYCREVTAKEFRTPRTLGRKLIESDTTTFITVYMALVRTKLESYVQAASPCLKCD